MADIVISEFMDTAAVATLAKSHDVLYDPSLVDRTGELSAAVAGASALVVRNRTQVRGPMLTAARRLRVVGRLGVGLDNIDLEACARRGIEVCPATGANDIAVAEYVVASVMMLFRGAYHSRSAVIAGAWPRTELIGRETVGKRLGLIGFGAIARKTAVRALALGMSVGAYDPYVPTDDSAWDAARKFSFEALLAWADAVSLHVPLTDETHHLIDARAIRRMRPGSILVNAARGGIVDEDALAAAVGAGHLAGVALDVFEHEPLIQEGAAKFAGLDNLVLTPHIAGVTHESNARVSAVTAANVLRVLGTAG